MVAVFTLILLSLAAQLTTVRLDFAIIFQKVQSHISMVFDLVSYKLQLLVAMNYACIYKRVV